MWDQRLFLSIVVSLWGLFPTLTLAQNPLSPNPNQDRFPQPVTLPSPLPTPTSSPTVTPSSPSEDNNQANPNITIQTLSVKGTTVFQSEALSPIIEPLQGKTVPLSELKKAVDQITQLYLEKGYITSRAILAEETLNTGNVVIEILEGSLESIEIKGTNHLDESYIRSRVELGTGTPLNTGKLEDQLRLLKTDPMIANIDATLKAGTGLGKSILTVTIEENPPFSGEIGLNNYSPPSVGSERLSLTLNYANLVGQGDIFSFGYDRTLQGGIDTLDFSYRLPINPKNGTLQLRSVFNWNSVIQENLSFLDINGNSQLYELSYRQPLIRTPREELALSIALAHQNGQTFTFAGPTRFGLGPNDQGVSRTTVLKLGQDYTLRDSKGAWAFRSLFSLGTGLFDPTTNPSPIPDGYFMTWLGQIQRVQVLSPDQLLIIQGDLQYSPDPLLPSQQFVIGGGQSVRGYRQNARAGDNGFRFSLEDRITLLREENGRSLLQIAPFFDMGKVWNVDRNPNTLQKQRFLISLGLGLLWQPISDISVRMDYGFSLIDLQDTGTNTQDDGFSFSVNYGF